MVQCNPRPIIRTERHGWEASLIVQIANRVDIPCISNRNGLVHPCSRDNDLLSVDCGMRPHKTSVLAGNGEAAEFATLNRPYQFIPVDLPN